MVTKLHISLCGSDSCEGTLKNATRQVYLESTQRNKDICQDAFWTKPFVAIRAHLQFSPSFWRSEIGVPRCSTACFDHSIDQFYCFSNLAVAWLDGMRRDSRSMASTVNDVLWKWKLSGDSHRSFHCWCLLAVIPEQIWRGDSSASLAAKERQVMLCRTILS